jgi:signal transduction histidine kinase/ligand-binding sensor domain-containing protein
VNCILQDSYGFMWFATDDGLNRYDGHDLVVYKNNPADARSLSHNRVWSLFEDSAGVLWVGTYGGGLNRLDRNTGQFTRYDSGDFGNVTDEPEEFRNIVWALAEGPAGVLWIATYGGGLVKFDLRAEAFTSYAPDPADPEFWGHEWITALLVDQSGMVWAGTNSRGLNRLEPTTGQITSYRHHPDNPDSLGLDRITSVIQDSFGAIWIGTAGRGLDRFDPGTGSFAHYQHDLADSSSWDYDHIRSITQGPAGVLWIGTNSAGLTAFNLQTETFQHFHHDPTDPYSLSSDRILCTYQDRAGILWVGTRGGGVNRLDPASARFTHYLGDPDDPRRTSDYQILSLHEDAEGLLWIGTSGGGLDVLNQQTGEWRHHRHDLTDPHSLGDDSIRAIFEDVSGAIWIGTENGLYHFDRQSGQFRRLPHNPPDPGDVQRDTIHSIFQDSLGMLWLGTFGRGLSEFDPVSSRFTYHQQPSSNKSQSWESGGLSNNWVHDVVEDRSGNLWIATQDGLSRYDRQADQWHSARHQPDDPSSLSNNWIISLYLNRAGDLWLGTLGGGLDRLALSEVELSDPATWIFDHNTEQDGLSNNMVLDIVESDGFLWLSTANGLSRYDPRTETFKNYRASDGLPVNEFSAAHASASGELFAGGINGFVSFSPAEMGDNTYVPPVVLTSLLQDGVAVDTGVAPEALTKVTFQWPANSFEFSFAALNYNMPARNQHAYKLEGFDRNWNYIGSRRFGRYTNLPGGSYTLRLRGSNNDGVWNEEGTSIKVTVVPPFWQSGWFWACSALIAAGTALVGYRLRVRSLEMRSRELEQQVEERTADLRNEIDQRIRVEQALHRRERAQVVTEERNRLARELHDSVTQALYGATLYSEAAAGQLALGHSGRAAEYLAELQDTAQEALAEMRLLVFELRPPILEDQGLVAALQARLQAVEGRAGLRTEFKVNLDERLPLNFEEGLYRIALEGLNNTLKHAQAQHIKVRLQRAEPPNDTVLLEVSDDGQGFDPAIARQRGGMGLAAMAERAAALGGRLTIWSEPGSGTRIRVVWPEDDGGTPNE